MKIVTEFVYPPVPFRDCDWSAVDADTYDVDCDENGYFSHCPIGRGSTEIAAIRDLLDQIEERKADAEAELAAQQWWAQQDQDQQFVNQHSGE